MVDDVVGAMRARYGADWGTDDEANLRFSVDAEHLVRDVSGAHLIGEAEVKTALSPSPSGLKRPFRT